MSVGENIRRIRLEKGITQKELGEKSGINPAQIRRYELGGKNSNPKLETIQKIADALEVSIADIDSRQSTQILHELVNEGLQTKLAKMPEEAQIKLQETLERIVNEGSGGLICIIL